MDSREAVVWCDDHGPLAYLSGPFKLMLDPWPAVGDVVELATEQQDSIRRVVSLVPMGDKHSLVKDLLTASGVNANAAPETRRA